MNRLFVMSLLCCAAGLYSMEYNEKQGKKSFFSWVKNLQNGKKKKAKKSKDKRRPINLTISEDKYCYNFLYVKKYRDIQLNDIDTGEDITIEEYYRQFRDTLNMDSPLKQLVPS